MTSILALDLGGTRLKAGVVDVDSSRVVASAEAPTGGTADDALQAIGKVGAELGVTAAAGWALSVPGLVSRDGVVVALPGKFEGLVGLDLARAVPEALGFAAALDTPNAGVGAEADVQGGADAHGTQAAASPSAAGIPAAAPATGGRAPVVVNDAIAYGVGEAVAGSGRGHERVVVVTLGTGVGVTVLEHGWPVGDPPLGGGILGGQIPISEPDGPLDTNERAGTIEARCRAERIVGEVREAGGVAETTPDTYDAYRRGDEAAVAGITAYRQWLARALVALIHAHAPSVVVLGGGPVFEGAPILDGLADDVRRDLWPGVTCEITAASLGDHAALVGLAHLWRAGR